MNLNDIEQEVICLCAVYELIDAMVNREIMDLDGALDNMVVSCKSMTHKQYLSIMLVDFLSQTDSNVLGFSLPYLRVLTSICDSPYFNHNGSVEEVKESVQSFKEWLSEKITTEPISFSALGDDISLTVSRYDFLKICGNISKHNFTRLSGVVNSLISIFQDNGKSLSTEEALSSLEDFYEWFYWDRFSYNITRIAKYLNDIRWGIHIYLKDEYMQSLSYKLLEDNVKLPQYVYPSGVNNSFARQCYIELMNKVRTEPLIGKFTVNRSFAGVDGY